MEAKKAMNNVILTFGIFFGIMMIAFNYYISSPTDDPTTANRQIVGFIALAVFFTIPILAIKYYKDKGFDITFGQAVKLAVLLGIVGGIIGGLYTFIHYSYLKPETIDQVIEIGNKVLEKSGVFTPEQIAEQAETSRNYFIPIQVFSHVFNGLLYGVIAGLLGGLFFKTPSEDY